MFRTPFEVGDEGLRQVALREVMAESYLHLVDNEYYGEPLAIEDWAHEGIWVPVFGAGTAEADGRFTRRFRRALVGLPRGVGKTYTAAAMLIAEATMNPVRNGQYGLVGDSKDNVRNLRDRIADMIAESPYLSEEWEIGKGIIRSRRYGSWIRVFPNDEGAIQGYHFNLAICDEVHVYRDRRVWEAVTSGQSRIPNALAIAITTASAAREGFLWELYRDCVRGRDPSMYCYWVGLDDGDDLEDREAWRKVLVSPRQTMAQLEDQHGTLSQANFVRYQLNYFPRTRIESPFVDPALVEACEGAHADIDRSRWYAVGVDAAPSGDDTAVVAAQQRDDGTWAFREWVWPGGTADFEDLADVLQGIASDACAPTIVIDPNRLKLVKDWLYNNRGVELYDMPQSPRVMAPASELLRYAVEHGQAALGDAPTLARHLRNAVAVESKAYGDRLGSTGHGRGSARIDAAVAAAMAMTFYDGNLADHPSSYGVYSIAL